MNVTTDRYHILFNLVLFICFPHVILIVFILRRYIFMLQIGNRDSEDESSDDEVAEMIVDEPKVSEMVAETPKPEQVPDKDGWSTVRSKRNKGKKSR